VGWSDSAGCRRLRATGLRSRTGVFENRLSRGGQWARQAPSLACETNVGIRRAGQGIQSLQTALHAAGARTAITSLWKVDDAATRKLMERFYTYL
jgi:hypothetical protein